MPPANDSAPLESAIQRPRSLVRRLVPVLLVLGLGLILGLGAAWWLGGKLTQPARYEQIELPSGLAVEPFELRDARGSVVRGWNAPQVGEQPARGVVILLHGIRGHRGVMLPRARMLAAHGYATILPDLQAHGSSDGYLITLGDRERFTVLAVLEFAKATYPDLPCAVLGVSLGGAAATLALPLDVDALILESVFPDVESAIHHRVSARLGPLGALPAWLLLAQLGPRLGVSPDALRPVDRISQATCPVLILSGAEDPHTPAFETERLFAAASEPKELLLIPDAGHVDLYDAVGESYEESVMAFLNRYL